MNDDELYEKLVGEAISFVSYRPRSAAEIRVYIEKKLQKMHTVHATLCNRVMKRMYDLHYIDDQVFAESFIDSRLRSRPKSRQTIIYELQKKGIPKDVTISIFEKHDGGVNDRDLAKRAIEQKLSKWSRLPTIKRVQKIYGFLSRRGFRGDTIRSLIDESGQKEYNTDID